MPVPIYVVVLTGLVGTIVALWLALRQERTTHTHRAPWIIALAALGIDSVFHISVSVGALIAGGWESMWIVIGSTAIAGVFATAWRAPRIAGWWLITTALALPLILMTASAIFPSEAQETVPVSVLLTFYTPRMLIVGGLLIWSITPRRPLRTTSSSSHSGY